MRRPADSSRVGAFDFRHPIRNLPFAELIQSQGVRGVIYGGKIYRTRVVFSNRNAKRRHCVRISHGS